jgi:hypothetical protein
MAQMVENLLSNKKSLSSKPQYYQENFYSCKLIVQRGFIVVVPYINILYFDQIHSFYYFFLTPPYPETVLLGGPIMATHRALILQVTNFIRKLEMWGPHLKSKVIVTKGPKIDRNQFRRGKTD